MEHYVARKNIRQYNTNATFTRSSSAIVPTTGATVTNNVTRIVNDGVLVEEGTTNLIASTTAQATFATSDWTQYLGTVATITQNQPDPLGGNGATRIQTTGGSDLLKYFRSAGAGTAGTINQTTVWIKNNSAVTLRVFTNQGAQSLFVSQEDGWVKFDRQTTSNGTSGRHIQFRTTIVSDNLDFFAFQPQIEEKSYATTFAIGTRSAERLQVPVSSVSVTQGTIDIELEVTAETKRQGIGSTRIFNITRSNTFLAGFILFHQSASSNFRLEMYDDAGGFHNITIPDTAIPNGRRLLTVTWDTTTIKFYIDGVFHNSRSNSYFPTQFFGFDIGSSGSSVHNNSVYYNVRTSSRARTNTEVLASFTDGLLPDDDTTFMLFPPTYYIQSKTDWNATDKINFTDFNRIESNTSIVRSFAEYLSYSVPSITTVTNRTNTYLEYLSSINRIEQNIESIKANGFTPASYGGSETWTLGKGFDYDDANRLEGNLVKLLLDGEKVFLSYVYSGQVNAGHQRGDLPL